MKGWLPPGICPQTGKLIVLFLSLMLGACDQGQTVDQPLEPRLLEALALVGQTRSAYDLPKVPYPVSTEARLPLVNRALRDSPWLIELSGDLAQIDPVSDMSDYSAGLLRLLEAQRSKAVGAGYTGTSVSALKQQLTRIAEPVNGYEPLPGSWSGDSDIEVALRSFMFESVEMHLAWQEMFGRADVDDVNRVSQLIAETLAYKGKDPDRYRPVDETFFAVGQYLDTDRLVAVTRRWLAVSERLLSVLKSSSGSLDKYDWLTPLGPVRLSGGGDDRHHGEYLLLVDTGGDDSYENIVSPLALGGVAAVIDLDGNDSVAWDGLAGPGGGVLGSALWIDLAGDDTYTGYSLGLGAGFFGVGVFSDRGGSDRYYAHALSQGVGQYGIGIMLDAAGDDRYRSALNSQGYGGSGGFGILSDTKGNDHYECAKEFPDIVEKRIKRHRSNHYVNLCQGYGFGIRGKVSGGVGLLIDHAGEDTYKVDIFGQGASYWFGLGMLIDVAGDDHYEAFEHAQGEGLHLGAGLLSDRAGDDVYKVYEHGQGVGKDRGPGVLYDHEGDDRYEAFRESQGAGLASYGFGLLVDRRGDDNYVAGIESQGYSGRPEAGFPESEWPTGVLLDLQGKDVFDLPYSDPVTDKGRVQNRQGVAIDIGDL